MSKDQTAASTRIRVFISYSRNDSVFSERLRAALVGRGFEAYLDKHDIAAGEAWQERLSGLITDADAVVFCSSPHFVASQICDWEVNEAERLGKRLLPVVVEDTSADKVPGRLKRLNYVFMRNETEFATGLELLVAALVINIDWIREHTRISGRAIEWERAQRPDASLLRDIELTAAEHWRDQRTEVAPRISELVENFISASRRSEIERIARAREDIARTRRFQRLAGWGLAGIGLLLAVGLAAAIYQARSASEVESRVFASLANRAFEAGNCELAMRYALSGLPAEGATPVAYCSTAVEDLLRKGVATCPILSRLKAKYNAVVVLPGGTHGLFDGTESDERWNSVWNIEQKTFVAQLKDSKNWRGGRVAFGDGSKFGQVEEDNVFRIYSTHTGEVVASLTGVWQERNDGYVNNDYNDLSFAVSSDGRVIAIGARNLPVRLFDVASSRVVAEIGPPGYHAYEFNSDGTQLLIGADYPQRIQVWDIAKRSLLAETASTTHQGSAKFSPDGKLVGIAGLAGGEFWRPLSGEAPVKFAEIAKDAQINQNERVYSIAFHQDGRYAVVNGEYSTYVLDLVRQRVQLHIEQYQLSNVRLLADNVHLVASIGRYGTDSGPQLGIWRLDNGKRVATIPTSGNIEYLEFMADGTRVVTGSEAEANAAAEIWDLSWLPIYSDGVALQRRVCARGYLGAQAFSPGELVDPILQGRSMVPPCNRRGPLSLSYWTGLLQ